MDADTLRTPCDARGEDWSEAAQATEHLPEARRESWNRPSLRARSSWAAPLFLLISNAEFEARFIISIMTISCVRWNTQSFILFLWIPISC